MDSWDDNIILIKVAKRLLRCNSISEANCINDKYLCIEEFKKVGL